jgi:hypothetical protein
MQRERAKTNLHSPHFLGSGTLVHWTKVQSELAYILTQNVKGVRWPPLRWPGVANEPLASEKTKRKTSIN